uniref:CCHC-type domain-containing protein n=1 Tax=Trichogramma kaykai TaxID=54128 RepID=A0ABD2WAM9_9HYME
MKTYLLQAEADRDANAPTHKARVAQAMQNTCFKCNEPGHMVRDCPNGYFCYLCKAQGDHVAANCPNNKRYVKTQSYYNNSRGRGKGRGEGRGRGGGKVGVGGRNAHRNHPYAKQQQQPNKTQKEKKGECLMTNANNDYSRYARTYCVKNKSDSGDCLEDFLMHIKNLSDSNERVCYIRADNGTEFTGGLLFETPLSRINEKKKSHIGELKRFGCLSYVRIPIADKKFSKKAITTYMVGHTPTGYLLWHPATNRFITSRHVQFNEKVVYKDRVKGVDTDNQADNIIEQLSFEPKEITFEVGEVENIEEQNVEENIEQQNIEDIEPETEKQVETVKPKKRKVMPAPRVLPERRAKKEKLMDPNFVYRAKVPIIRIDDVEVHANLAKTNEDPVKYKDALESSERASWIEAIEEELKSMKDNNVWTIIDKPQRNSNGEKLNLIDSKWVFKKKVNEQGESKYKARLVIRGFKDKNSYELKETYAPVSRLSTIRTALAVINKYDLDAVQLDVKTAFLNGELEDEIYMEIPDGLEIEGDKKTKVCKLQRTIYGLKTSPKIWNQRFTIETPMVTKPVRADNIAKLTIDELKEIDENGILDPKADYRGAIGSLMYLATVTRPDIAFAVNFLSRKQASPNERDWQEVKRIFRYLRGTTNVGLTYQGLQTSALKYNCSISAQASSKPTAKGSYSGDRVHRGPKPLQLLNQLPTTEKQKELGHLRFLDGDTSSDESMIFLFRETT